MAGFLGQKEVLTRERIKEILINKESPSTCTINDFRASSWGTASQDWRLGSNGLEQRTFHTAGKSTRPITAANGKRYIVIGGFLDDSLRDGSFGPVEKPARLPGRAKHRQQPAVEADPTRVAPCQH